MEDVRPINGCVRTIGACDGVGAGADGTRRL